MLDRLMVGAASSRDASQEHDRSRQAPVEVGKAWSDGKTLKP